MGESAAMDAVEVKRRLAEPRALRTEPSPSRGTVPALLVLASIPVSLPNIFGAGLWPVGLALLALAALIAVAQDGARTLSGPAGRALRTVVLWTLLAYMGLLVVADTAGVTLTWVAALRSLVMMTVGVTCAAVVLSDPARARMVARFFVWAVAAFGLSYVVTAALLVSGVGAPALALIEVGGRPRPEPIYFPFTITVAEKEYFGIVWPRLNGFAREPGLMAMYAAVAYFLAREVTKNTLLLRAGIVAALLGTFSTAGLGIFLVTWLYGAMIVPRPARSVGGAVLRQFSGLVLLVGSFLMWVTAPEVGLLAKVENDPLSIGDRMTATQAGLRALWESPFGGGAATEVPAVNLIAAVAAFGVLFAGATLVLLWGPWVGGTRGHAGPALLVITGTILFSQPMNDSLWIVILVALVYAVLGLQVRHRGPGAGSAGGGADPSLRLADGGRGVHDAAAPFPRASGRRGRGAVDAVVVPR